MKIYGNENNAFLLKEMGERIRDVRIAKNLTQEQVADDIGVSWSTIKRIESGTGSTLENFLRILRYFNFTQNLDILIPEQQQSAEEIYRYVSKRQRVGKEKQMNTEFKWGDEL